MSRSYKKNPWCGDNKGTGKKRVAWKSVRQWLKSHPDVRLAPSDYKKIYETYDICDYGWLYSWGEYWKHCQKLHEEALRRGWGNYLELNEDEEYRYWYKHYKGK